MKKSKLKNKLLKKPKEKKIKPEDFLSSGSTLANLACTDRIDGCFVKGTYHNLVGDSDTGKSVLGCTILQEAAVNPEFDKYELVYVNAERAKLMDFNKFFPQLAKRIQMVELDSPEEFYFDLDDRLSNGPVVLILDSMDSLIAKAQEKKFKKQKSASRSNKEEAGTYGMDKAKINAANLNRACSKIGKNGSILIIISQTRDNVNAGLYGPKKTRSGGTSMKFYNRWEVWLSGKDIKKEYKGKKIQIGVKTRFKVAKNHITGKKREIEISIYNAYGVDDIGDCIDYLTQWKYWKKSRKGIAAKEFKFVGSRDELIAKIENKKARLEKLRRLVGVVWRDIEKKIQPQRRPKYEAF